MLVLPFDIVRLVHTAIPCSHLLRHCVLMPALVSRVRPTSAMLAHSSVAPGASRAVRTLPSASVTLSYSRGLVKTVDDRNNYP